MISPILNTPWTIFGLLFSFVSLPKSFRINRKPFVVIVQTDKLWLNDIFMFRRIKGFTLGRVILLSNAAEKLTYKHEFIHVQQFDKFPFVFPFLYLWELVVNGYTNNKYEIEAREAQNR